MAPATVMARSRFPVWPMAVMLVLLTIALYWPATRCDFVNYDDDHYVIENTHVTSGLSPENIRWAFRNSYAANWHPITWVSHMMDCQLFGLKPWGHHLTSVLLHAINTVLVFLLLRRLTGALWRSLMVAALFGLHPLHVESVAWVAERKDVLSACFGLLALLFYTRYAQKVTSDNSPIPRSSSTDYGLSLFFFALGLMSKAMLVTWPFVMLLLDYWPLHRFEAPASNSGPQKLSGQLSTIGRLMREKIPFFVLVAMASIVTFVVQKHGGALTTGENLPLGARSGNALISYCRYLGKLFWPADLAVFYPRIEQWPLEKVLLAGGLILGVSVLLVALRQRRPFLLFGWLWYCGTLVPVIGLVQIGAHAMADRYIYIPSLGVMILAIWGVCELARRWRHHMIALSVAGLAALVLCLTLTWQQIGYWKDSETLFRHALEVTENNYLAHNNLGNALLDKGQNDAAIGQFQATIRLKPDDAKAHYNLGTALNAKGQTDEAIGQLQATIYLRPDYAEAHNNLGIALEKKGQNDEAILQFQEAVRLKPDNVEAHNNLGSALGIKGQTGEAIRQFQEAVHLRPDYAEAHNNLGIALEKKGQIDEAIRQFQEAIRLKPDEAKARNNLRNALLKKGQIDEAVR